MRFLKLMEQQVIVLKQPALSTTKGIRAYYHEEILYHHHAEVKLLMLVIENFLSRLNYARSIAIQKTSLTKSFMT